MDIPCQWRWGWIIFYQSDPFYYCPCFQFRYLKNALVSSSYFTFKLTFKLSHQHEKKTSYSIPRLFWPYIHRKILVHILFIFWELRRTYLCTAIARKDKNEYNIEHISAIKKNKVHFQSAFYIMGRRNSFTFILTGVCTQKTIYRCWIQWSWSIRYWLQDCHKHHTITWICFSKINWHQIYIRTQTGRQIKIHHIFSSSIRNISIGICHITHSLQCFCIIF